jgi:hypothetical protein
MRNWAGTGIRGLNEALTIARASIREKRPVVQHDDATVRLERGVRRTRYPNRVGKARCAQQKSAGLPALVLTSE